MDGAKSAEGEPGDSALKFRGVELYGDEHADKREERDPDKRPLSPSLDKGLIN